MLRFREGDHTLMGSAMAEHTGKMNTRWLPHAFGMALVLALSFGCSRQAFLADKDITTVTNQLVNQLERDPTAGSAPIVPPVNSPPTVDFPDRLPRELSLPEALAIALENGTASSNFVGGSGPGVHGIGNGAIIDDTPTALTRGILNGQSDRIRVLALNPAIAYTNIEASESRFDAKWITVMNWTVTDTLQNGLANFNNGETAAFNSSIVKAFASGGVANITFNTNYTDLSNPPIISTFKVINPLYTAPLQIGIEQPLLQNFGVGINQLLNQVAPIQGVTMPLQAANFYNNSRTPLIQGPNFSGLAVQGIVLARLSFDQARAEFERQIHNMLLNVELAYWKLYQSYGALYSNEQVLHLAHKAWRIAEGQFAAGKLNPQDYYPILAQYEEFRGERLKALGLVLEAERNLRGLVGLPVEDGMRIIPVTAPTLAPYVPNWQAALDDAIALRPELVLARQNLKNAQISLTIQNNFLKPDLRFVGQYSPTGYGTTLNGNGTLLDGTGTFRTANAFRSLGQGDFVNWTAGLTLNVPLGYRLEHAAVRSARLQLAQAYYFLQDQEQRIQRALAQQFQKLDEFNRLIETSRAEREAYAKSVKSQWELYKVGTSGQKGSLTALVLSLLDYQRRLALAQNKEYQAIADYNATLARFEWAKGTILNHDSVAIAEGPLPQAVQMPAVENERRRTRALILQERPTPLSQPARLVDGLPPADGSDDMQPPSEPPPGNGSTVGPKQTKLTKKLSAMGKTHEKPSVSPGAPTSDKATAPPAADKVSLPRTSAANGASPYNPSMSAAEEAAHAGSVPLPTSITPVAASSPYAPVQTFGSATTIRNIPPLSSPGPFSSTDVPR
jgi:outer membrane protein TolC